VPTEAFPEPELLRRDFCDFLPSVSSGLFWSSVSAPPVKPFPKTRRSSSAAASRTAELERLKGMSVEERIKEALSLNQRFRGLIPAKKNHAGGTGL
jgi:hypothetical protein